MSLLTYLVEGAFLFISGGAIGYCFRDWEADQEEESQG